MQIRLFDESDKPSVIALWHQCGLLRPWNDPQLDILQKQAAGAGLFLIGEMDGAVVASVMGGYDGHRGWMYYLAVSPEHQKLGLGAQIVQNLEKRLVAVGCPKINLQVRRENDKVLRFYEKLGYSEDACLSLGKRLISDTPAEQ